MDKAEERKIVEMVFGDHSDMTIEESERPDFICRVPETIEFGVEVTDFFLSESAARLRRIPNYAKDLLTSKAYRHKDDRRRLPVESVVYRCGETGEEREIEAIVGEEHTIDDVVSRISMAISSKTYKSSGYSCDIVDLIVRDVDSNAGFDRIENLMRAVRRTGTHESILRTTFREIYLLTAQKGDWVCVPLQANLFVAEILKFQRLFKDYHGERIESITLGGYLAELIRHLVGKFGVIEYDFNTKKQLLIVYGSVAVGYGENQGLEIRDISLHSARGREVAAIEDTADRELEEFVGARIDSMFACAPIHFPAKQSHTPKTPGAT